jgi:hypothetical protein
MQAVEIITTLQRKLNETFRSLAAWTVKDARLRAYRPAPGSWCINEVLEHIALANRYLLLLIEKGTKKALKKADPARIAAALEGYRLTGDRLEQIGVNDSFEWKCPAHMMPSGMAPAGESWMELEAQKGTLLDVLADLRNGEGALHKTGMSVNRLGRLDVYQYLYFLLLHCRRHIGQMEEVERDFETAQASGDDRGAKAPPVMS